MTTPMIDEVVTNWTTEAVPEEESISAYLRIRQRQFTKFEEQFKQSDLQDADVIFLKIDWGSLGPNAHSVWNEEGTIFCYEP